MHFLLAVIIFSTSLGQSTRSQVTSDDISPTLNDPNDSLTEEVSALYNQPDSISDGATDCNDSDPPSLQSRQQRRSGMCQVESKPGQGIQNSPKRRKKIVTPKKCLDPEYPRLMCCRSQLDFRPRSGEIQYFECYECMFLSFRSPMRCDIHNWLRFLVKADKCERFYDTSCCKIDEWINPYHVGPFSFRPPLLTLRSLSISWQWRLMLLL